MFAEYRDSILAELFHRVPKWWRRSGVTRHFYKSIVDYVFGLAMNGLRDAGIKDPDASELRRLVRRFLAYTRRGRTGMGIPDFERFPHVMGNRLAAFIQKRWAKQNSDRSVRPLRKGKNGQTFDFTPQGL